MSILEILKELGIFGILVSAIGWVAKKLGEHQIDKNVKILELNLNQQLEKYKSELEILNEKNSKLHDKRLAAIHELYGLLIDFYRSIDNILGMKNVTGLTDEQIEKEKFEEAKKTYEAGHSFSDYYEKNKLYFDRDTCALIEDILSNLKSNRSNLTIEYQWMNLSMDLKMDLYEKAYKNMTETFPELKTKLEDIFRTILGVN